MYLIIRIRATACRFGMGLLWLPLFATLFSPSAQSEDGVEALLFPDIVASHRPGLVDDGDLKQDSADPTLDLLLTGSLGAFQFLGEFKVDAHEKEIARLHAGWRVNDGTTLSIGKFHNLQGYWNTQFHHGAFLQDSISRPGIIEDDGPLPTHYVGVQMEGDIEREDGSSIGYAIGVGTGARLVRNLESPDIVGPNRSGKETAGLRLSYSPFEGDPTQIGVFLASNRIPVENNAALSEIRQSIGGAFGNWENGNLRVLGELYLIDNKLIDSGSTQHSALQNAYLQGEYRLTPKLMLFGRTENSAGSNSALMLQEFHEFAKKRNMLGVRYELARHQTIKVESGRVSRLDNNFGYLQLQWSAVFP